MPVPTRSRLEVLPMLDALAAACPGLEALKLKGYVAHRPESMRSLKHLSLLQRLELSCRSTVRSSVPGLTEGLRCLVGLRTLAIKMDVLSGSPELCMQVLDGLRCRGPRPVSLERLSLSDLPRRQAVNDAVAAVVLKNRMLRSVELDGRQKMPARGAHALAIAARNLLTDCVFGPFHVFREPESRINILNALDAGPRTWGRGRLQVLAFRRAHEAKRDAGRIFHAAAHGRPLELAKRLRLGVLAGGAESVGELGGRTVSALQAARQGGHDVCVKVLQDAQSSQSKQK